MCVCVCNYNDGWPSYFVVQGGGRAQIARAWKKAEETDDDDHLPPKETAPDTTVDWLLSAGSRSPVVCPSRDRLVRYKPSPAMRI